MNKENFSDLEKDQARKNGFILCGKTGTGKSTLLNAILGEEIAVVKKSAESVTQKTTVYYYKLRNDKMISILDTPGLMDPKALNNPNIDNVHLDDIRDTIRAEKIEIKGIIFLRNFQNERFDSTEQEALINYNKIFPLKDFWNHIVVIFTHYFADPDGDTEEEMKKIKDSSNRKILGQIMDKVKNVSDVINYNDLITKYFNSYCPVKTEKQRVKNNKNREELEVILNEISNKGPLLTKIEIATKKNFAYKENNKYYKSTLILIGYFCLGEKPIKENKYETDKTEISHEEFLKLKDDISNIDIRQFNAKKNQNGEVLPNETDNPLNSYYWNLFKTSGIGGLFGAVAGAVIGISLLLTPIGPEIALTSFVFGGGIGGAITGFIRGLFNKN